MDSRFLTGSTYRYDYLRVAWSQFKDHPLKGVGAGNYDTTYFLKRRTSEDIRQPHSLALQTLGELGAVGGLALLAFAASVLTGLWRQARRGRDDDTERLVAVAAGGTFLAWLAHTNIEWLHLLPGVTGIALVAAAVLLSPWVSPVRAGPGKAATRVAATAVAILAILAATHTLANPTASNFLRIDAQDKLGSDPLAALRRANQALSLEGHSTRALYAKSAAYARLDRYGQARAALRKAARLEPHDHIPWALLGDLAARRGDLLVASRDYHRAFLLNPKDLELDHLATDPQVASREARCSLSRGAAPPTAC